MRACFLYCTGSERADKTGASAERLKEAQNINKSLSALGDVIAALSEGNAKFIPYRNNKLTQLMQDSLGGNAKTLMFVNFSPADYNADETVSLPPPSLHVTLFSARLVLIRYMVRVCVCGCVMHRQRH